MSEPNKTKKSGIQASDSQSILKGGSVDSCFLKKKRGRSEI
jgi:hypothetical protein